MKKPDRRIYLPLLERALESEVGLGVATNDPIRLRQELSELRKESSPQFDALITFIPEGNTEVFICQKNQELPE